MTASDQQSAGNLIGPLADILITALAAYEAGDLDRAEEILRQVVDAKPDVAAAWHIRGLSAQKQGDLETALKYLGEAASLNGSNAIFQRDFGAVASAIGFRAEAISALERSAALDGNDPATRFHLANALMADDKYSDAIKHYRFCVDKQPDAADAHNNLAAAYRRNGDAGPAIEAASRALAIRPRYAGALNNLALALCDQGKHAEAVERFERALEIQADDPEILNNLGVAYQAIDRWDTAEDALRRSLTFDQVRPETWLNLGNLLRAQGQFEEAAKCYQTAIELEPDDVSAYGNLGFALLNLNRPEAAIATYEKALELVPGHPDIRMSLGIAQLTLGNFEQGWQNYESRWRAPSFTAKERDFNRKVWTGEPLAGESILVYAEQGFGDTLQFSRYLSLLADIGAEVHFECQRALFELCGSLDGIASLTARNDPLPSTKFCVPLLSLPSLLRTTLESVPAQTPYLRADTAKTAAFRAQLDDSFSVGIVWRGNHNRADDALRSCPRSALDSILATEGIQFVSLQVGDTPDGPLEVDLDFGRDCKNFSDTAAAVEALDLIVTVDTATAHLAGALAKPVWVMLGHHADWRYLLNRADSPWYPSMRLFRQEAPGAWQALTGHIAKALSNSRTDRNGGR